MITIVTGRINDTKTTRLIELHAKWGGDGIAAVKTMAADRVRGYDAVRLSSGERHRLALHNDNLPEDFKTAFAIGPYHFDEVGVAWVEKTFDSLLASAVSPLYFDEIGLLEVCGKGFSPLIERLLRSGRDLVLVVRDTLIDAFAGHYRVDAYVIHGRGGDGDG